MCKYICFSTIPSFPFPETFTHPCPASFSSAHSPADLPLFPLPIFHLFPSPGSQENFGWVVHPQPPVLGPVALWGSCKELQEPVLFLPTLSLFLADLILSSLFLLPFLLHTYQLTNFISAHNLQLYLLFTYIFILLSPLWLQSDEHFDPVTVPYGISNTCLDSNIWLPSHSPPHLSPSMLGPEQLGTRESLVFTGLPMSPCSSGHLNGP